MFKVGDRVVCVDADLGRGWFPPEGAYLVKGLEYEVHSVSDYGSISVDHRKSFWKNTRFKLAKTVPHPDTHWRIRCEGVASGETVRNHKTLEDAQKAADKLAAEPLAKGRKVFIYQTIGYSQAEPQPVKNVRF